MGNPRVLRQLRPGIAGRERAFSPDRRGMERAIAAFLEAAGVAVSGPNFRQTPQRVAEAWITEFLDGYGQTPEEALGETYPAPSGSAGELVVLTDLQFHSMCPHHLLPYNGLAHLAYVLGEKVVGFGRLSALMDCYAHRLILQEELVHNVAAAMARVLGSPATACIVQAEHACLRLRGHRQHRAKAHTEAYEGLLRRDRALRQELWARIGTRP